MKPLRPRTIDGVNWRLMLRSLREGIDVSGLSKDEATALRSAAGRHVHHVHCRAVPEEGESWRVEVPDA